MRRRLLGVVLGLGLIPALSQAADPGAAAFAANCALCHQTAAQGLAGQFPRLAGRVSSIGHTPKGREYLGELVLYGMTGRIVVDGTVISGVMPTFASLPDDTLAAILNYLLRLDAKGKVTPFKAGEIHALRRSPPPSASEVHALRATVAGLDDPSTAQSTSAPQPTTPPGTASPPQPAQPTLTHAQSTYSESCGGCHGLQGVSAVGLVPSLRARAGFFLCTPAARSYIVQLPNVAFAARSDSELAELLNFVTFDLGGDSAPTTARRFSAEEVRLLRTQTPIQSDVRALRRAIVRSLVKDCKAPAALATSAIGY